VSLNVFFIFTTVLPQFPSSTSIPRGGSVVINGLSVDCSEGLSSDDPSSEGPLPEESPLVVVSACVSSQHGISTYLSCWNDVGENTTEYLKRIGRGLLRVVRGKTRSFEAATLICVCDMLFSQGPQVVSKGTVSFLLVLGSLAPVTACSRNPDICALARNLTVHKGRKTGLHYMLWNLLCWLH
jgi:hypothetical protein